MKSPSATAKGMLWVAVAAIVIVAAMKVMRKRKSGRARHG